MFCQSDLLFLFPFLFLLVLLSNLDSQLLILHFLLSFLNSVLLAVTAFSEGVRACDFCMCSWYFQLAQTLHSVVRNEEIKYE